MTDRVIAIGSRGSALALIQAHLVLDALTRAGRPSRIVIIETEGDRRSPDTAWGEGAFVGAIERALLDGRIDVAVHSAKDVPTDEDPELRIAAYLPRADPRDALVVRRDALHRRLADLSPGTRVGTDSPRRTGFLLAHRPDLLVHPLHGNVDTRLARLDAGATDALVLACAGLDRLGCSDRIAERLPPATVPPAPGQGAIAVQIRAADHELQDLVAAVDDRRTRQAVEAERAFLIATGGGCRAPVGALATIVGGTLDLLVGRADPDGSDAAVLRRQGPVDDGEALGRALAVELRPSAPTRVLVTRAADQAGDLLSALRAAGLQPVPVPAIEVELGPGGGALDDAARDIGRYAWVVLTSANGARALLRAAERVLVPFEATRLAVVGSATGEVLERQGADVAFVPSRADAGTLAAELPLAPDDRVLVIRGDLVAHDVAATLRRRGATVDAVVAYRTREAPAQSGALLRSAVDGSIAATVFTSGSTIRGLLTLGQQEDIDVRSIPVVCLGPETAAAATAAGFHVLAVSPTTDPTALAAATTAALARQPQEAR